jgi:hypothetical protein
MKTFLNLALAVALCAPSFAGDLVVTTTKHSDARPDKDVIETKWIGKDRMRVESGRTTLIVRADLKRVFVLDTEKKTFGTMDLPFDVKKHAPPDVQPQLETMLAAYTFTVEPTSETKKIGAWNATRYTITIVNKLPDHVSTLTEEVWATKDVPVDSPAWHAMNGAVMSYQLSGPDKSDELKKIEGLPVFVERTRSTDKGPVKSSDTVTSVATKDAPEGTYDVPKDYVETKPFLLGGGAGAGDRRPRAEPAPAPLPPKKDDEKPVPPPK